MATALDDYLASRKYDEQYHDILDVHTYDDAAYLGLSASADEDNNNDKVKRRRRRRTGPKQNLSQRLALSN